MRKAKKHVRVAKDVRDWGAALIGTNPADPSPLSGPNTAVVVIIVTVRLDRGRKEDKKKGLSDQVVISS